jgi:hypothetical protein
MDLISQTILNIRSAAGNPNKVCPTCCRLPDQPYRVYEATGHVMHGCIDPVHTAHMDRATASGQWHFRKEAVQHRQRQMMHLRSLVNPS